MESHLFLAFFYTFLSFYSEISAAATDTLALNQSLTDGQTLVSSDQTFELGFFSLGNSRNKYVGISYKNISFTVVWVANRENPLTDSSGILTTTTDGNIILLNGSKKIIWSSNLSTVVTVKNPVAQLLQTGNFVLKDGGDGNSSGTNYLWQSFDHPCDTLVLGVNNNRHKELTSWKSMNDPSHGEFSYGIELDGLPHLVLRKGEIKKFRSGPWNGLLFSGLPYFWYNPVFKPSFTINGNEGESVLRRIVLNQYGALERFTWNNQVHGWRVLFRLPQDECDNYGQCGVNSICDINKRPVCECLQGFDPKSPQDWLAHNWTNGCLRRTKLSCGNGDEFLPIKKGKLPDVLSVWSNDAMSLNECKMECLKKCSCAAYANSDYSEGGSGCILWFGDLIDIRMVTDDGVQDLYIRLAASDIASTNKTDKKGTPVTMIVLILSIGLLMLVLVLIILFFWKKMRKEEEVKESQEEDLELPLFDWKTVATATSYFSHTKKIGEGGFGTVYKGKLAEGQEIAVKRLSRDSGQGLGEFKNEVVLISKLQHRNLVKLLGCCIHGEEKMLIYEYMPNKSLDYFIFDQERRKLLAWPKRFDIIMGIARGILYLHQDSRLRIVHRDVKTSNILLDGELNPKISDFGMARLFAGDQTEAKTKRVVGTYGYMSPEYALDGRFSTKSDIFSFGVVVLEIVSGKKNRGFSDHDEHHTLLGQAWKLWKEGNPLILIDACLEDSCVSSEVLKCIQVGLLCVQQFPSDRPSMSSIVRMLGDENAPSDSSLHRPKQPGLLAQKNHINTSSEEIHSENSVSISMVEAR